MSFLKTHDIIGVGDSVGISHMGGTPWHVEGMYLNEGEERRHKSRCIYYNNRKCTSLGRKCIGSSHCPIYEAKKINDRYKSKETYNRTTYNRTIKKPVVEKIISGNFKVKFLADNEIGDYVIGDNIRADAPIVKEVYNHAIGESFKINDEEILIVDKNLYRK